jgi:hypothetical protein
MRTAALDIIENNAPQFGRIIEETIARWDGDELSRKLELEVGRDLQFVRINGTLVGGFSPIQRSAPSICPKCQACCTSPLAIRAIMHDWTSMILLDKLPGRLSTGFASRSAHNHLTPRSIT